VKLADKAAGRVAFFLGDWKLGGIYDIDIGGSRNMIPQLFSGSGT
jgi:hypothetical protein